MQFVGVYVTRWQPEWGQPSVGFVEVNENEQAHTADRLTPAPDRNDRQKGKIMDARVSGKIISYGKQRYRTNMKGIWHVLMFGSHGPTDPPVGLSWKWISISEDKVPSEVKQISYQED